MKRTLTFLLSVVLLCCTPLPVFAEYEVNPYLVGETSLAKLSSFTVTTGKKTKQLELRWSAVPRAGGYEIFRCTTGKSGSYKKIDEGGYTSFTDTGLKSGKTYYYAVRAYAWNGERVIYSPFKKASFSTHVSKATAAKRFNAAYKAMGNLYANMDYDDALMLNEDYDGYRRLDYKNITTKTQLKKYLLKYFSQGLVKQLMPKTLERNGKLYLWRPGGLGGADSLSLGQTVADKVIYGETAARFRLVLSHIGFFDDGESFTTFSTQGLSFEKGRWVIDETNSEFWVNELLFDYTI